jgi:O-antigen ligase
MRTDQHIPLLTSSQSRASRWLQRTVLAIAAVSFVLLALFFLTVAVIVGTVLALAIGARLWWISRKLRAQAKASAALEGEYVVVERERARELDR